MARLLKKLSADGPILAVIMISLTAIITHGISIPSLGYYHDDWYMLWSGASRGAESMIPLFSLDRPFMGVIYVGFYRLIGESILGWHIVTLLERIAGGLAFYWILTLVWPKLKNLFILAGMLFVVFPGFLSEPNAATKINHLLGYGSALFSIAFTLQALRTSRRLWKTVFVGLSLLLMALYMWIYEYMIGLEVMRLSLMYVVQWQDQREKLLVMAKKLLQEYIPNLAVIGLFLFWRVFLFDSTRYATDLRGLAKDYAFNFVEMVTRLIFQAISDFFSASLFAWFVQPYHLLASASYSNILIALLFAVIVVGLAIGYVFTIRKYGNASDSQEQETGSPLVLVLIGGLIALAAVFPVVLLNRHLDLMDAYKSYGLHPSAGALIMVIGLVAMLKLKFRKGVLITLLALSVATQSLNIQYWADLWQVQRNMWWQLSWRAPNILDYTLVMAYAPDGYAFQQDYEIWGPIDLIYRPGLAHFPMVQAEVLNRDTLVELYRGKFTEPHVRDIYLPRDYRNMLLLSQPSMSSCIHVIDNALPVYSSNERPIVEDAGAFSSIGRVDVSGKSPVPPSSIFGQEPEHGWCYYYQQASLARQKGDWRKIGELYQAVVSAGLKGSDSSEYFVFVEGLVNLGRMDEAKAIVEGTIKPDVGLKYPLCKSLAAAPAYPLEYGYHLNEIRNMICAEPAE